MKISALYPVILCLFYYLPINAQNQDKLPIDEVSGLITYKEVVQETGTREEFFNRAVLWINTFYNNPADVTRTRDPQTGLIEGLHRFKITNTGKDGLVTDAGIIQYEFTLEFKENRYRYILTGFVLKQASRIPVEKWMNKNDPQYTPQWESYLTQISDFSQKWIENLKKGLMPPVEKNDDDW